MWRNDVEEFMKRFSAVSKDHQLLEEALFPTLVGDEEDWADFWRDYGHPIGKALSVVAYRIKQGQAKFNEPESPDEHLIEAGKPHTGYVVLRDIVETTVSDIMLVDAWVDRTLFDLLSNLKTPGAVRFLTRQDYLPIDFVTEAKKFSKEAKHSVGIRVVGDIHDRFLVIDGRLYFSGASFKDWGKKSSVVSEMKDVAVATINHQPFRGAVERGKGVDVVRGSLGKTNAQRRNKHNDETR
jgi:hypothetical protein